MQVAPAASSSPGRENHNRLGPDILVAAYNHQTQSRAIETLVCVCVCVHQTTTTVLHSSKKGT